MMTLGKFRKLTDRDFDNGAIRDEIYNSLKHLEEIETYLESVGKMADSMDNILSMAEIPLPANVHKEQLVSNVKKWSLQLKEVYCICTKTNPWE